MSDVTDLLLAEIAENIKSLAAVSPLSAAGVLDLLKTVDGAGSGLDADMVCGVSAVNRDWTNSSGVIIPAIGLTEPLLWYSNNNWYIVTGADFVLGGWKYNSTNQAIVINSYTGGKIQFRSANSVGHVAGDAITWAVDTYLSLDTHNHTGTYQPLNTTLTNLAALTPDLGYLRYAAPNGWEFGRQGNQYLTYPSGSISGSDQVYYYAGIPIVVCGARINLGTNLASGGVIAYVPTGYRPNNDLYGTCVIVRGGSPIVAPVKVENDGEIRVYYALLVSDTVYLSSVWLTSL